MRLFPYNHNDPEWAADEFPEDYVLRVDESRRYVGGTRVYGVALRPRELVALVQRLNAKVNKDGTVTLFTAEGTVVVCQEL